MAANKSFAASCFLCEAVLSFSVQRGTANQQGALKIGVSAEQSQRKRRKKRLGNQGRRINQSRMKDQTIKDEGSINQE